MSQNWALKASFNDDAGTAVLSQWLGTRRNKVSPQSRYVLLFVTVQVNLKLQMIIPLVLSH